MVVTFKYRAKVSIFFYIRKFLCIKNHSFFLHLANTLILSTFLYGFSEASLERLGVIPEARRNQISVAKGNSLCKIGGKNDTICVLFAIYTVILGKN